MLEATIEAPGPTTELQPHKFDDFYRSKWQDIYRPLAVTLRNADLARDATDEGMVRAYQRWSTVRKYDNPTGWVYRGSLNWARSRLRKLRRETKSEMFDKPTVDPDPLDPMLGAAVARLNFNQRAVVVLRYLYDMSQEDVAEYLGIPLGTVRSRIHRALEHLRREVTL